jgi:hypothetical protein
MSLNSNAQGDLVQIISPFYYQIDL